MTYRRQIDMGQGENLAPMMIGGFIMGCLKYTVSIDEIPVAKNMVLEHALILTEALFHRFFMEASEVGLKITIQSEVPVDGGNCCEQ